MRELARLFENNRKWVEATKAAEPDFFSSLAKEQKPDYLWIGCSDSRVPANEIVGLPAGELFVHRNVANLVIHSDMNCLSVIQFAVDVLRVKHIIVCGHYGCGGVRAAVEKNSHGLIDNWLRHIKDVAMSHRCELSGLDEKTMLDRLCELNIKRQVLNVCCTTFVQDAWKAGRTLCVHGWIYSLADGLLRDLGVCSANLEDFKVLQERLSP